MKFLLVSVFFVGSMYAATTHVYNKSNQPIRVSIKALDFGKAIGLPFYLLGTGGRSYDPFYEDAKSIAPGNSAFFNSGLTPIENIYFYIPGREAVTGHGCSTDRTGKKICQDYVTPVPVIFRAQIGMLQVEQKVEYFNPDNIRKL